MRKEEEENIKIVAEFIGVDLNYSETVYKDSKSPIRHLINNKSKSEKLEFDISWDWLMVCVEKIESLGYFVGINKWTAIYEGKWPNESIPIAIMQGESKINNTFIVCVDFIKGYNWRKSHEENDHN